VMREAGIPKAKHVLMAYVLIGYLKDSFESAEDRLERTIQAGFTPMAMLWRDEGGYRNKEWSNFQRRWARPRLIYMKDDQKRLSLEVR